MKTFFSLVLLGLAGATGVAAQGLVSDLPAVHITLDDPAAINTESYTTSQMTIIDADGTQTVYADTRLRGRGSAQFALT